MAMSKDAMVAKLMDRGLVDNMPLLFRAAEMIEEQDRRIAVLTDRIEMLMLELQAEEIDYERRPFA